MVNFEPVTADLAALVDAAGERSKSLKRQLKLAEQLHAAASRKPPNLSVLRRLLDAPAQQELVETFDSAGATVESLRRDVHAAWDDFALNCAGDFRQLAVDAGLEVVGQSPKLTVGRGIDVTFKVNENKSIVNGVSLPTVDPEDVLAKVQKEIDRLWGGEFDAATFLRDLYEACEAEINAGHGGPEGVSLKAVFERLQGELPSSTKKTFQVDVFAAQLSRAIESGERGPNGTALELKPVRDPRDAVYVYLPHQRERAHRGLIAFREARS